MYIYTVAVKGCERVQGVAVVRSKQEVEVDGDHTGSGLIVS